MTLCIVGFDSDSKTCTVSQKSFRREATDSISFHSFDESKKSDQLSDSMKRFISGFFKYSIVSRFLKKPLHLVFGGLTGFLKGISSESQVALNSLVAGLLLFTYFAIALVF